jgi:hypothetical protein
MTKRKDSYSDSVEEKKFIRLLKSGDDDEVVTDLLKKYYFHVIEYGLQAFTTSDLIKEITSRACNRILRRRKEAKDRNTLTHIVFEEVVKAYYTFNTSGKFREVSEWLERIEVIFLYIERLPDGYRGVVHLRFELKTLAEIQEKTGYTMNRVVQYAERGSSAIRDYLVNTKRKITASIYEETVYNQIFLRE